MFFTLPNDPALTLSLALAAGIISQILAHHLRIPGIVLLLAAGFLLGPEVLGLIDPSVLGHTKHEVVGFAVAVILFEGGLNLDLRRLRREALPIRRFITFGAAITLLGGAVASHVALEWSWSLAVLFGSLVIVTGPTVITPLLRRIRVDRQLETILSAEGVFIDAIGAILAVVALEIVVQGPTGESLAQGLISPPVRLLVGITLGLAGGGLLTLLIRVESLIPDGMQNTFSLAWAVALYHVSNVVVPETGIAAVIAAGLLVGNTTAAPSLRELKEFKEQVTVLLIGLLFVLLAADVALDDMVDLGTGGILVVAALMFLVRPLSVVASTRGSNLTWRQQAFLAWVAPRGIVAAAISSLFADRMAEAGMEGGDALRALVFLVIAGTVVLQGASASLVARILGVRRPRDRGYAILGANPLARLLARRLQAAGEEIVILDANQDSTEEAQAEGLQVVFGNAAEKRVMLSAKIESRRGIVGLLTNSAQNLLFAQKGQEEGGAHRAWVALQRGPGAPEPKAVKEANALILFGGYQDIELWGTRVGRKMTRMELWEWQGTRENPSDTAWQVHREDRNQLLPLLLHRRKNQRLVDEETVLKRGDRMEWLILSEVAESAQKRLRAQGWNFIGEVTDGAA